MRVTKLLTLGCMLATAGACDLFYLPPPEVDYETPRNLPSGAELPERVQEVVVDDDGYASFYGNVKTWSKSAPVANATVTTIGTNPADITGDADAAGAFALDVPLAGVFWARAGADGYVYTYEYVRMPNADYSKDMYIVSEADFQAWADGYGKTPNPSCGSVVADIRNVAAQAYEGVPDVHLAGADYEGPYYLNGQGEYSADYDATSSSGKVVFFNVCDLGLQVASPGLTVQLTVDNPNYTVPTPSYLNVYAGYITHGSIQVEGNPNPNPDPDPVDVVVDDFYGQIYPILQQEACAACHAVDGPAAGSGLYMTGTPEEVYTAFMEGDYRINLQYPEQSLVLTKPLYEDPPNHPNASFPSVDHPDYQTIYAWIQQGAKWYQDDPPPVVDPPIVVEPVYEQNVDFFTNVMPRFSKQGCINCHNGNDLSGGLNLMGTPQQVYDQISASQTAVVDGYPEQSYLYTKPNGYYVDQLHDGAKPIIDREQDFARYVGGWINENTPYVDPGYRYVDDHLAPVFVARGCTGCHNEAGQANYGDLRLDLAGQDLIDELLGVYDADGKVRVTAGDLGNSLIITKPWDQYPNVNHTGGKIQVYDYYREFNDAIVWVYEGAQR